MTKMVERLLSELTPALLRPDGLQGLAAVLDDSADSERDQWPGRITRGWPFPEAPSGSPAPR